MISRITAPFDEEITPMVSTFVGKGFLCFASNKPLAIFATTTPIISAIGHETDTTIADFVADKRAPTPSAAAMMATPDRLELLTKLSRLHTNLLQQTQQSLANYQYQLIALIMGVVVANIALANTSSLNAHGSSNEPPPRAEA
jgi:exodeoxyribonuclease VII large subunit